MMMLLATLAFWVLCLATFLPRAGRARLASRTRREWVLDGLGLIVQGWVVPLVAAAVLAPLWRLLVPSLAGFLSPPGWVTFLVGFVLVDYLYYWNHRLFHASSALWSLHRVHHTVSSLDVLGTSRNSLWSSFFIVYVWATSLATYLLADPAPYLVAVGVTVMLDLWRHSALDPPEILSRALGVLFVMPRDHAWHHAGDGTHGNYGANLVVWDHLHGTRFAQARSPEQLGLPVSGALADEILRPWKLG